jgi:hypothetical protein
MPLDKAGKYHMNPHHAKSADTQASKPGTEPQPGPDGMSGGAKGGKDLSAGIPTPKMAPPPASLESPASAPASSPQSAPPMAHTGAPPSTGGGLQHPAHEAADQMHDHMASMDPSDLMDMKTKLESILQEITDLLGSGATESQGASMGSMLGGY